VKARRLQSQRALNIYPVDWANLTFIDLAKAKTPEGRAEQVRLARDATHKQGFFYVINHGLDKATVSYRSSRFHIVA
jgi:isopenicillin N synthase-like dioxygenase